MRKFNVQQYKQNRKMANGKIPSVYKRRFLFVLFIRTAWNRKKLNAIATAFSLLLTSCYKIADSGGRAVLRRGSAAARLLGLRVGIPPAAWMSLESVVCCQVEVCVSGWSLVQRSPTECGVSKV
jgi:hypothetical protein